VGGVGEAVGDNVGEVVGDVVGYIVGDSVGEVVGECVGGVGDIVGEVVGDSVGDAVGYFVGEVVGENVGADVGGVGDIDGEGVGDGVGGGGPMTTVSFIVWPLLLHVLVPIPPQLSLPMHGRSVLVVPSFGHEHDSCRFDTLISIPPPHVLMVHILPAQLNVGLFPLPCAADDSCAVFRISAATLPSVHFEPLPALPLWIWMLEIRPP
jgi:hypothetical protein